MDGSGVRPGSTHSLDARPRRAGTAGDGGVGVVVDIGGTRARLALVPPRAVRPTAGREYPCDSFDGPVEAIEAYLSDIGAPRPTAAVVAVAAPVTSDKVELTNRRWMFSTEAVRQRLGLERLVVVNDFTALAHALPCLSATDVVRVGRGAPVPGRTRAVIGPGTGLGVSGLIPCGEEHVALAAEGGHADLAPGTAREVEVLRVIQARFGHASAERVLSGPGLVNLHRALTALDGVAADPLTAAEISARGRAGSDRHCVEALATFFALLGSVAGDLALTLGAQGGVYIGGGIVPQLLDAMAGSTFRDRFVSKDRCRGYLEHIPTFVITHPVPALLGAAALLRATIGRSPAHESVSAPQ